MHWAGSVKKNETYNNIKVKVKFTSPLQSPIARQRLPDIYKRVEGLGLFSPLGALPVNASSSSTVEWTDPIEISDAKERMYILPGEENSLVSDPTKPFVVLGVCKLMGMYQGGFHYEGCDQCTFGLNRDNGEVKCRGPEGHAVEEPRVVFKVQFPVGGKDAKGPHDDKLTIMAMGDTMEKGFLKGTYTAKQFLTMNATQQREAFTSAFINPDKTKRLFLVRCKVVHQTNARGSFVQFNVTHVKDSEVEEED